MSPGSNKPSSSTSTPRSASTATPALRRAPSTRSPPTTRCRPNGSTTSQRTPPTTRRTSDDQYDRQQGIPGPGGSSLRGSSANGNRGGDGAVRTLMPHTIVPAQQDTQERLHGTRRSPRAVYS